MPLIQHGSGQVVPKYVMNNMLLEEVTEIKDMSVLYDSLLVQGGPKNDTTLVRPTAATVQDKRKWISLKCSQRLRK